MSKPTQPPAAAGAKPAPQARALANSKWARGPPQLSQPASAVTSPLQSPNPSKDKLVPSESATTSAPSSTRQSQAGQPRKGAAAAAPSKAVNIPTPPATAAPAKNPALNFGTVDDPESAISSSPATKLATGAHLGQGEKVKSFGSVAAAAAAAQAQAPAVSSPAVSSTPVDKPADRVTDDKPAASVNGDKTTLAATPTPAATPAAPAATPAAPAAAPAPSQTKPKFDPHKAFQKAPVPAAAAATAATPSPVPSVPTAASISPAPVAPITLASPALVPQQLNPYANVQAAQHNLQPGQAGIPQARGYNSQGLPMVGGVNAQPFSPSGGQPNGINQPRGQPHRSPIMNHSQPGFNVASGTFQPTGGPGRAPRQTGPPMGRPGPGYVPQGMPGQQFSGMPPQFNPYGGHNAYGGYDFNPGYPYPQHYQGMQGGGGQPGGPSVSSPSMGRPSLHNAHSSFSSTNSGIPTVGGGGVASPMSPQIAPGTPQQASRTPSLFSPGAAAFTPGGAVPPTFTPGGSAFVPAKARVSAVKITRDDGTAVDLSNVAKTVKGSGGGGGPSAAAIAAAASVAATASPKPAGAMPVTVRIESPVQKELRQKELEEEKKRKELDEREEKERKERKEKKEREDKEREQREAEEKAAKEKERAEKEQKDAEAKVAADAEAEKKAADAEAEKKAADAEAEKKAVEAEAEKKAVEAEADKKATESAAAADAEKKDQEEKEAAEAAKAKPQAAEVAVSEAPSNPAAIAGLPSKPSSEVLEKASLAAPDLSGKVSATPSPMASPAISHVALPAKPELAATEQASGSQQNGAPAIEPENSPFNLSLKTAKVIEDIRAITYPASISAPLSSLNETADAGKFRYNREFLLQFLGICKDRVPVEASLGMLSIDRDDSRNSNSSGGFARGGSQRGGPRGQQGGRGPAPPMGSFQKGSGAGMGSFGTGMFSGAIPRTSEERVAASRASMGSAFGAARNSQGGMSRTTSQAGPMGNMGQGGMRNDSNRARSTRGKQRGGDDRRQPMSMPLDPNVAPLEASANRWTPAVQNRRPGQLDENSPEFVERKVKGLLNKLTAEKFDSISSQILEWANKSVAEKDGQTLRLVIKLIFEKAKDEQFWSTMYAKLCRKLWQDINPEVKDDEMTSADGQPLSGGLLFRKYLLNRCQEDFEKGWKQKADASAAAKEKAADDQKKKAEHDAAVEAGKELEEFKFSDEYYAEQAAKRKGLGLVKFVGELFKLEMVSIKVIHACIVKLLSNVIDPDEEDVESLCQLLTTVGGKLEAQPRMAQQINLYMQRMNDLKNSEHLSSRIRFMVQDVIELERNHWRGRNAKGQSGSMTIDEVHAQVCLSTSYALENILIANDVS
ncbi:hypothetical protein QFC19_009108 [Naganishia cerealis]|uniref:Uncharacterized protein n=1 Tax=Naganishia cerealis TaxID=610337 RepID=A0ACC2UWS5_9TREE|nr:hypothetical protein QFC19_009108 [Naganishia cerealis]